AYTCPSPARAATTLPGSHRLVKYIVTALAGPRQYLVVRTFRSALSGRPKGLHYYGRKACTTVDAVVLAIWLVPAASAPRTRVEKLPRSWQSARRSKYAFDTITETAKFPDHLRGAPLRARFGDGRSAFIVDDTVMEDFPDKPTEPVRDRP